MKRIPGRWWQRRWLSNHRPPSRAFTRRGLQHMVDRRNRWEKR